MRTMSLRLAFHQFLQDEDGGPRGQIGHPPEGNPELDGVVFVRPNARGADDDLDHRSSGH